VHDRTAAIPDRLAGIPGFRKTNPRPGNLVLKRHRDRTNRRAAITRTQTTDMTDRRVDAQSRKESENDYVRTSFVPALPELGPIVKGPLQGVGLTLPARVTVEWILRPGEGFARDHFRVKRPALL